MHATYSRIFQPSVLWVFDLCTVVFMVLSEETMAHKVQLFYPILLARKQLWQDWQPGLTNICTQTEFPAKE